MKSLLTLLFVLSAMLYSTPVAAQETIVVEEHERPKTEQGDSIYKYVDESAQFPGGNIELFRYINKNLKYPQECLDNNIEGKIYLTFVVEKDGSITNVDVIRMMHPAFEKEAIRLVMSMPNWIPGKVGGVPVRSMMTMPLNFTVH